jgi:hypothetical protein
MKNIIVEVSDGVIVGVYCPDDTYNVNILDHDDREAEVNQEVLNYYNDLEKEKKNLVNLY